VETTAMVARSCGDTTATSTKATNCMQIELAKGRVRIEGRADVEMLRVVLEYLAR
jgi:hypothetical protein